MPSQIDISGYADVRAELDVEAETIRYPIDAFFLAPEQLATVAHANDLLWDACMEEGGRSYPPAAFDMSASLHRQDTYYGIWSPDRAARLGYSFDASAAEAADAAAQAMMAADQDDSGWGPAFDACVETVERLPLIGRDIALDEDQEVFDLPQAVRDDAKMLASRSPRWDEARAEWSDCLTAKGLLLQEDETSPWAPEVPEDPEAAIRTAVLDVQCKEETGLVETLSSLEAQYQAALIDQNRAALDEVAEKEQEIIAHADEILAEHGR